MDNKGVMWFGSGNGIIRWEDKSWKLYNPLNSCLPSFFVNKIAVDSRNRKWFATNDGLLLIE
jgi:ligand-binding sensor domain-containing protein